MDDIATTHMDAGIGGFFMRTETEFILESRKVYPKNLLDAHFIFRYDDIEKAMCSLIKD